MLDFIGHLIIDRFAYNYLCALDEVPKAKNSVESGSLSFSMTESSRPFGYIFVDLTATGRDLKKLSSH